jgi:hypothetical protein
MMRFVAIIGIVFWIIFALIKSIPFHGPDTDLNVDRPMVEKSLGKGKVQSEVQFQAANDGRQFSAQKDESAGSKHREPDMSQAQSANRNPGKKEKLPRFGVRLQFHSLEDLLELIVNRKVLLFCRAQATGFDLFFTGYPHSDTISFRGAKRVPPKLWEITSGKDHAYFFERMTEAYPAIGSFPSKEVLISFVNKELESRLEQTLTQLTLEGQSGILSITRTGELVFRSPHQEQSTNDLKTGTGGEK